MEFMSISDVKDKGIHDGTVILSGKVVDEVIYNLEFWCIRGISIAIDTVDSVHEIRSGI